MGVQSSKRESERERERESERERAKERGRGGREGGRRHVYARVRRGESSVTEIGAAQEGIWWEAFYKCRSYALLYVL